MQMKSAASRRSRAALFFESVELAKRRCRTWRRRGDDLSSCDYRTLGSAKKKSVTAFAPHSTGKACGPSQSSEYASKQSVTG